VATKGVESVVIAKASLEVGDGEEADGRNGGANDQGCPGLDKAGARGDCDQAGDQAGASANKCGLAGGQALDYQPRSQAGGACGDGVEQGERGDAVGGELGASVKAKPAKP